MICKPCEEKSEVCFTQLLSELNASVLHYEILLLSVCRGVCPCEYDDEYLLLYSRIRPGEAAFNPDCTLYRCSLTTTVSLIAHLSLSCFLPVVFQSGFDPASIQPTSVWIKELGNQCICRKSVSKLSFIALCNFFFSLPPPVK